MSVAEVCGCCGLWRPASEARVWGKLPTAAFMQQPSPATPPPSHPLPSWADQSTCFGSAVSHCDGYAQSPLFCRAEHRSLVTRFGRLGRHAEHQPRKRPTSYDRIAHTLADSQADTPSLRAHAPAFPNVSPSLTVTARLLLSQYFVRFPPQWHPQVSRLESRPPSTEAA